LYIKYSHLILASKSYVNGIGLSVINRDRNAVYNDKILFNHYVRFLQGKEKEERPLVYSRSYKLTDNDKQLFNKSA